MTKVKCIKAFVVGVYDDDGFSIEESEIAIDKDSIWDIEEHTFRIIGGDIRLIDDNLNWIEIPIDKLGENFEIIK